MYSSSDRGLCRGKKKTWDGPLAKQHILLSQSQDVLNPFKVYMSNAIILFFHGKMPSAKDVSQWMNTMFKFYAMYQNRSTKLNYLKNLL